MQSKVLCVLFVTLVASSVTDAGLLSNVTGVVKNVVSSVSNATNSSVPQISIPSTPNILQLPNLGPSVEAAEKLVVTALGSVGNLADTLQNVITAALKGVQPLADLINILTQILNAFSQVAAGNPLDAGLLILNTGLQLVQNILRVVIPVVVQGIALI